METIAAGQNWVQKRDDRTVVEIFSEERIGFVKEKFLKLLKLRQFLARILYARCAAFQSIFQARIQEAHDGNNFNYIVTYGVLALRWNSMVRDN